ncbi:hypothetical protein PL9631_890012 [Planktothrix paucivesiculata PCC 9631]|uniref:Uncharacterized protein n=1 Tax=Planktothrix paucivesiculata PCC 9631 TaxID=671071 RepID=A0A7Z9BXW3_9CYAN|nr:hypothetical protein PL9631_890012 [Planktothrix paucivesiculata PCC 9631]
MIEAEKIKAGRFILATNILDKKEVSNENRTYAVTLYVAY